MKLFHVSQKENNRYDTYSDFVCCCETEEEAKRMDPSPYKEGGLEYTGWHLSKYEATWASDPSFVHVKYIGESHESIQRGVICASFNPG